MNSGERTGKPSMRMVFVGGMSRSGTTLLQGLICRRSDVSPVTEECSHLRFLIDAYVRSVQLYNHHLYDYFDSIDAFRAYFSQFTELYTDHLSERFGDCAAFVQKEPTMTAFFPELAEFFPDARFILICRDFRDVAASQKARLARSGAEFDLAAFTERYRDLLRRLAARRAPLAGRALVVRYEALTTAPTKILAQIDQHLLLPASDTNTLRWIAKRNPERHDSASPLDGAPPSPKRIGAFAGGLSRAEISYLETALADMEATIRLPVFTDPPERASALF